MKQSMLGDFCQIPCFQLNAASKLPSCTLFRCLLDFTCTCPMKASAVKPFPIPTNPLLSTDLKIDQHTRFVSDLATEMQSKENGNKTEFVSARLLGRLLNMSVNTCEEKIMCCFGKLFHVNIDLKFTTANNLEIQATMAMP